MRKRAIDVAVAEEFAAAVDEEWVRRWVEAALDAEGVGQNAEVSVFITGDDLVRELNRDYLGLDEPTDVLSFPFTEEPAPGPEGGPGFVQPPDNVLRLGEIIIAYPYATRQAVQQEHPVDWELAHLLAHGVLHLLGYDHLEPEDEQEMRAREHAILGAHY